uniref:Uncharacterized protein n=1 Tax=Trichogramma kaykai TaxID=54128 RepID=A0ABD2XAZ9_9HYME
MARISGLLLVALTIVVAATEAQYNPYNQVVQPRYNPDYYGRRYAILRQNHVQDIDGHYAFRTASRWRRRAARSIEGPTAASRRCRAASATRRPTASPSACSTSRTRTASGRAAPICPRRRRSQRPFSEPWPTTRPTRRRITIPTPGRSRSKKRRRKRRFEGGRKEGRCQLIN